MDYSKMDMGKFINMVIDNSNMCPCLMIGKYVNEFKRVYKGRILTIYSLDSVRKLIEMGSGLLEVNGGFMVLEGVGYLSSTGQSSLLKFIEESKVPIILLSYNDKISPIIMSRMKLVVKRWDPVKNLDFIRTKDAIKAVKEKKENNKEFREYQEIQYYADFCPAAYALGVMCGDPFDSMSEKIKGILLSI